MKTLQAFKDPRRVNEVQGLSTDNRSQPLITKKSIIRDKIRKPHYISYIISKQRERTSRFKFLTLEVCLKSKTFTVLLLTPCQHKN